METIYNLLQGFITISTPENLTYCLIGVLLGTLIGVLPGIGTVGTIALLLPFSSKIGTAASLILFCGIYYGSKYGGSTTSILMNVPGEASSIITCIDGYAMTQRGRAGAALAICAIGSFVAGTLGLLALTFFAPLLADLTLHLGPPEHLALIVTGIIIFTKLTGKSFFKSILMMLVGALLGTIGIDHLSGVSRFSFGFEELDRGIDMSLLAMGLFGLGEILTIMLTAHPAEKKIGAISSNDLYPTREEYRRSAAPILRGGFLGFLIGLIPGPSTVISTFASYAFEKKYSKTPERFGKGAIEGVAGPESANNAAVAGTMIPMLAMGLPFCGTTAIILSGFMIHGIMPGPTLVTEHPELFWGIIASMYLGNFILLVINYPLVFLFVHILRIPFCILMPLILALSLTGAYAINHSIFDIVLIVIFGFLGFLFNRTGFDLTPLIIGIVMGPEFEQRVIQTLIFGKGTLWELTSRPIACTILILGILLIFLTFSQNNLNVFSPLKAKPNIKE